MSGLRLPYAQCVHLCGYCLSADNLISLMSQQPCLEWSIAAGSRCILDLSNAQYENGLGFVVMMFTAILMTDVGCYYVGSKFGKHKLAPVVSPNKTIEGSVGGFVAGVLGACVIGLYIDKLLHIPLKWYVPVCIGILSTVFGQIGDLCESLIKRDAGVKDSGSSLPGHGGFLDRTDSFVLTIPIVYYFCKFFVFNTEWIPIFMKSLKGLF